jgi:hypothetical protein
MMPNIILLELNLNVYIAYNLVIERKEKGKGGVKNVL